MIYYGGRHIYRLTKKNARQHLREAMSNGGKAGYTGGEPAVCPD
jgi:hypothetical protein